MKKAALLLTILSCSLTLAQEKTFSFEKKIEYDFSFPEDYKEYFLSISNNEIPTLVMYIGKDALIGSIDGYTSFEAIKKEAFLSTNNRIFDVSTNSFENNLKIKLPVYYDSSNDEYNKPFSENLFYQNSTIKRLNTSENINGLTCNNFELTSVDQYQDTSKSIICIDEKNPIDNAKYLLPKENIKGLILKAISEDNTGFQFNKISTSNLKVTFDENKSIAAFNKKLDELKTEYNEYTETTDSVAVDAAVEAYPAEYSVYDDPIYSYYNFSTSDNEKLSTIFNNIGNFINGIFYSNNIEQSSENRNKAIKTGEAFSKQLIKQYKKNGLISKSEAKEINTMLSNYFTAIKDYKPNSVINQDDIIVEGVDVEEAWAYSEPSEEYISNYKNMSLDEMNFAFTSYEDQEELINTMPKYCTKSNIPEFKNIEFKNNVENYIGQLCDLYISKFVYNVGITETTDALRYSFLKINELKSKLSKEEQTKFDQFINNLD